METILAHSSLCMWQTWPTISNCSLVVFWETSVTYVLERIVVLRIRPLSLTPRMLHCKLANLEIGPFVWLSNTKYALYFFQFSYKLLPQTEFLQPDPEQLLVGYTIIYSIRGSNPRHAVLANCLPGLREGMFLRGLLREQGFFLCVDNFRISE